MAPLTIRRISRDDIAHDFLRSGLGFGAGEQVCVDHRHRVTSITGITGITGQDGMYLAEFLLSKGYEVFGLLRGQNNPKTRRPISYRVLELG